ncbi:MAG: hypothetical protein NC181_01330 [Clostridium sp.]|nr:hypothetical protein [Clostridium sp.]MCM1443980.1 hypothetical protein [Candidatus Amulumruptor caecigallinarius]
MDLKVNINGTEKNKNEIVYNNIIDSMEEMNISKQEQIEYLKQKITYLENNSKDKTTIITIVLIGFILLLFGIYLMSVDIKAFGAGLIILSFLVVVISLAVMIKKLHTACKDTKFDNVEQLRKMLNLKLK